MEWLLTVFIFSFGAIIGSFLNVVILRHNTGRSTLGRSGCFSCGVTLQAQDLVPIFSFLVSLGHCRHCKSKISLQYPLVEAGMGMLFLLLYLTFPPFSALYYALILSLLMLILVYDFRHKIIPDTFVYWFIGVSLLSLFVDFETLTFISPSLERILAGPALLAPFFLLWFISRGRWIGLGDGKLAWGIGWFLGLSKGTAALLLGVWMGALTALLLLVGQFLLSRKGKELTMKSEIPFAPFIILGVVVALFCNIDVPQILSFFSFAALSSGF